MKGKKRQFTCIVCPLGCSIEVAEEPGGLTVSGQECSRGEKYALQEIWDPRRILTGTVKITGGPLPRLPVKTTAAIPKDLLEKAAKLLAEVTAHAPVRCGELIAEDFAGSGADLIATRELDVGSWR